MKSETHAALAAAGGYLPAVEDDYSALSRCGRLARPGCSGWASRSFMNSCAMASCLLTRWAARGSSRLPAFGNMSPGAWRLPDRLGRVPRWLVRGHMRVPVTGRHCAVLARPPDARISDRYSLTVRPALIAAARPKLARLRRMPRTTKQWSGCSSSSATLASNSGHLAQPLYCQSPSARARKSPIPRKAF
jgi:hypothetical protein